MYILLIPLAALYIFLSFWARGYKNELKNKDAWFIHDAWSSGGRFIWPVSWKGHFFWFFCLAGFVIPVFLLNTFSILKQSQIFTEVFLTVIYSAVFVLLVLVSLRKTDGVLIKNDGWFDAFFGVFKSEKSRGAWRRFGRWLGIVLLAIQVGVLIIIGVVVVMSRFNK
jgi:hypothetical protein